MTYQKTGTEFIEQLQNNPVFQIQDQIIGWWFDRWMMFAIQCYYWPAFVVGNADSTVNLFKPSTYSICKI